MFKRMSVLVRLEADTRAEFARKWEAHAAPVSQLPKVRGYIQNHVLEELTPGASPIDADGFVELLWDSPDDMKAAFASPFARPMVDDEPNFLGHGSGYALARPSPLRTAEPGHKIICALLAEERAALDEFESRVRTLSGLTELIRDDVVELIPKPGMAPPQPVDTFLHLMLDSAAVEAAAVTLQTAATSETGVRAGLYRVRTVRFV